MDDGESINFFLSGADLFGLFFFFKHCHSGALSVNEFKAK